MGRTQHKCTSAAERKIFPARQHVDTLCLVGLQALNFFEVRVHDFLCMSETFIWNQLLIYSYIRNLFVVFIANKYAYKYSTIYNHITLHKFWLAFLAFHLSRENAYHNYKCRNTMLDDLCCWIRYSNWHIQENIQLQKPFENLSFLFMNTCVALKLKILAFLWSIYLW